MRFVSDLTLLMDILLMVLWCRRRPFVVYDDARYVGNRSEVSTATTTR